MMIQGPWFSIMAIVAILALMAILRLGRADVNVKGFYHPKDFDPWREGNVICI
jgi:hypothetical protein